MKAAQDILQSLRDFGWPILAYAIVAPIVTFIIPSSRSREERTARLLLVGVIIAVIEVLFFVGTEGGDILQVAKSRPAWGGYVLLLTLVLIGMGIKLGLRRAREGRETVSLLGTYGEEVSSVNLNARRFLTFAGGWLAAALLAVIWLWKIADGL